VGIFNSERIGSEVVGKPDADLLAADGNVRDLA
jgi:hypothetical protein